MRPFLSIRQVAAIILGTVVAFVVLMLVLFREDPIDPESLAATIATMRANGIDGPELRFTFSTEPGETDAVRQIMADFAGSNQLYIRDLSDITLTWLVRPTIDIQMWRGDVVKISVHNLTDLSNFFVAFYEPAANAEFDAIAGRLTEVLRERWPDFGPFLGP